MEIIERHIKKRINNPQKKIAPEGIILHYTGNPGTSARANANYFHNVTSRVSVNYVVDEHEIIELIPPYMKSYGTSDGVQNGRCVQIEMCHPDSTGKISEETLERVVRLSKRLISRYGCREILRHYDVTKKRCPLWYVEHPAEWEELKARILSGEDKSMTNNQDNTPAEWAREAVEWAVEKGVLRGDENGDLRLSDTVTREEAVTFIYRCWQLIK